MALTKYNLFRYIIIAIVAVLIASLWPFHKNTDGSSIIRDYEEIIYDSTLYAVTEYNSISYFVSGDTISGFHYDLIQAFVREKGMKLKITPEMSFEKRKEGLKNRQYDVITYGIPVTSQLTDSFLFTTPIIKSRQILVQRKEELDSNYVKNQLQLAKKTLHVEKGSPAIMRIHNLGNEIADTIYIREVERYGQEQLIAMVAHGDIEYAVVDENIARAATDSFPQLDINTGIGFTQLYSWAVRKESPELCDSLNSWLNDFMKTKEFKQIYAKYF
ncbi:transporter substrate-binding domain-containing protein [Bacteroides sp. OttesenSCG-928-F21]|nr:transporter substrate-binding domain-containing protein [Bacteroides sp. OttesenSCG-928-F21]